MSDTTAPDGLRERLANWLDSAPVRNSIIAVIVFNAIILGAGDVGHGHGVLRAADPGA
jgi:hypothetical protein